MLEETQSLLDSDNYNNNNNRKTNNERFLSTMKYYFRQPKTWDWIVGGLIICAVIATIILIV